MIRCETKRSRPHRTKTYPRPTILCIDDDPDIGRTIELRLSNYAVDVNCTFTGMQGIWQAVQSKPDLIITDLQMPQEDGDYLIECLRRNHLTANIPVIVFTGCNGQEVESTLRRQGADSFLHKPLDYRDLIAEIGKYVTLKEKPSD